MKLETFTIHPHIILFDGVCNLCNASVNFIIRHDSEAKFEFIPLQSAFEKGLVDEEELDLMGSVVYFQHGKRFDRSTAALAILKELDHPLRILHHLKIVPKLLRDPIYNLVASSRYTLFGKRDSCMVPNVEIKGRFIQNNE